MSKDLKIKGTLSKDYQQVYIEGRPTNLFLTEDGKLKTLNIKPDPSSGDLEITTDGSLDINTTKNLSYINITPKGGIINNNGITNCVFPANQLKLTSDADNYVFFSVAADGHLSITGTGTDDDLTLDFDGGIIIDSAADDFKFKDNGTARFAYGLGAFQVYGNSGNTSDMFMIDVDANGVTQIGTSDADGDEANLQISAQGDITLNSSTGKFIAEKGGTEFSATDSSYAGMILGYTHLAPTSATMYTLSTSMEVIDADAKVTFVAPPSGNVEIEANYFRDSVSSNKTIWAGLSDNATYNQATAELGDGSTTWDLVYQYGGDVADETDDRYNTIKFVAGGLTAGTEYTYWLGLQCNSATVRVRYGGTTATSPDRFYPPIIMKATALPASIHTDS